MERSGESSSWPTARPAIRTPALRPNLGFRFELEVTGLEQYYFQKHMQKNSLGPTRESLCCLSRLHVWESMELSPHLREDWAISPGGRRQLSSDLWEDGAISPCKRGQSCLPMYEWWSHLPMWERTEPAPWVDLKRKGTKITWSQQPMPDVSHSVTLGCSRSHFWHNSQKLPFFFFTHIQHATLNRHIGQEQQKTKEIKVCVLKDQCHT